MLVKGGKLTVWRIGVNTYCDCCIGSFTSHCRVDISIIGNVCHTNYNNELLHLLIRMVINYVNDEICSLSN